MHQITFGGREWRKGEKKRGGEREGWERKVGLERGGKGRVKRGTGSPFYGS